MRTFWRILSALAILVSFFFGTTLVLDYFAPVCPQGVVVELTPPFQKFGNGFAYEAQAQSSENQSDSGETPVRSKFLVCENGYALGPPHSVHAEIDAKGKGRFSHWIAVGFVFSASDNSNPNTNGKHYQAVLPKKIEQKS